MQVHEPACYSEEKRSQQQPHSLLSSPQIQPYRRQSIRSLLLEPDMEDLAEIWPSSSDLNDLNCPDEEEH